MAQGNAHSNPFVIAKLGASAGGLEAFGGGLVTHDRLPARIPISTRRNAPEQTQTCSWSFSVRDTTESLEKIIAPFERLPGRFGPRIWAAIDAPLYDPCVRR